MKAKTLVMSAIICGASICGFNFSTAQAATSIEITNINQNIETEPLNQKNISRVPPTNSGSKISVNHNKHKNNSYENHHNHKKNHHNTPSHHHKLVPHYYG